MANCPACSRPVAVARPRCLYCGAELPPSAVAEAAAQTAVVARGSADAPPSSARVLEILELEGADAAAVARFLGLSAFEAGQRCRRGGFELVRLAGEGEAGAWRETAREAGLRAFLVPEAEVRVAPRLVQGGTYADGVFRLRVDEERIAVGPGDLGLVVRGPIVRQYQTETKPSKIRSATLPEGYLFHLHRTAGGPALELDPGNFGFDEPPLAGALLEMGVWFDALRAPTDDAFRRMTPALAPAGKTEGVLKSTRALARPEGEGQVVLDNTEQFRFYSAWRAAVSRRRG